MSDWLLVRLARDGSHPSGWIVASVSGHALDTTHTRDAEGLVAASVGRRVVLIAPATDVLHASASLPPGSDSRLAQLAPFALEDQVAEDLESLHFAVGRGRAGPEGSTDVDVVSRALLEEWLAGARREGFEVQAVYALGGFVPELPGQLSLLAEGDQLVVRREGQRPVVLPGSDPELAVELALGGESLPEGLMVTVHADALDWSRWKDAFEAWRPRLHSLRVQLLPNGVLPLFAAQLVTTPGINLLQGSYAPRQRGMEIWKTWRLAAGLAAALLLLHLAGTALDFRRLRAEEKSLDASIQQSFSQAMPGVVSGGRPRARLEQRLAQIAAASPGRDGFLPMLAAVASSLPGTGGAGLQQLKYQPGALDVKLKGPDAADAERLGTALRGSGWSAKVQGGQIQLRSETP
ncbi:MAG: hypothetical protein RLZZ200_1250 [Pseudomonadota bacterium]|jgi:general secretion pathway protein L